MLTAVSRRRLSNVIFEMRTLEASDPCAATGSLTVGGTGRGDNRRNLIEGRSLFRPHQLPRSRRGL